jgi:predicted secreted protein
MCVVVYKDPMGRWKADDEGCENRNMSSSSLVWERDAFGHTLFKKIRFNDKEKTFEEQFPITLPNEFSLFVRH